MQLYESFLPIKLHCPQITAKVQDAGAGQRADGHGQVLEDDQAGRVQHRRRQLPHEQRRVLPGGLQVENIVPQLIK